MTQWRFGNPACSTFAAQAGFLSAPRAAMITTTRTKTVQRTRNIGREISALRASVKAGAKRGVHAASTNTRQTPPSAKVPHSSTLKRTKVRAPFRSQARKISAKFFLRSYCCVRCKTLRYGRLCRSRSASQSLLRLSSCDKHPGCTGRL